MPNYVHQIEHKQLRSWRLMLADGRLTPDMLSPLDRERLQLWILEHPKHQERQTA